MKLTKLSFAAIMVMGLTSYASAADTLADAFTKGKVTGAIQAYYWNRDLGATNADIFTTGLDLSYETAQFNGFGMKVTFQSSASPFVDVDGKNMFQDEMYASGAGLSEI